MSNWRVPSLPCPPVSRSRMGDPAASSDRIEVNTLLGSPPYMAPEFLKLQREAAAAPGRQLSYDGVVRRWLCCHRQPAAASSLSARNPQCGGQRRVLCPLVLLWCQC